MASLAGRARIFNKDIYHSNLEIENELRVKVHAELTYSAQYSIDGGTNIYCMVINRAYALLSPAVK